MRITFVLPPPGLSGGIRVIAVYAERLLQRGHDVLLVHPPNYQPPIPQRLKALLRGRPWSRIPHVYPSHLDGLDVPRKMIERWRPVTAADLPDADVVVATWWETAEWVNALPPSKGAKAYFIQHYEIHDSQPAERVKQTWALPMHKIVVAQWLADIARDIYDDSDVSIVPNSVDTSLFYAAERTKQPEFTVGFMHAVVPWKGTDLAVAGVALAQQKIALRCLTFGMHPPTKENPIPEAAEFVLLPDSNALREIYASSDAWIVASRSEGFGLPILESMACRTPVIGTPAGAAPELIGKGGGVLVPHENPQAIADAILRLASMSEEEWRAMSDIAYSTARSYSWNEATLLFEKALRHACARRPCTKNGLAEAAGALSR